MLNPEIAQPTLIQDALELQMLLERLEKQPAIAVDTESNSLHAYREQVCLIQISIPGQDFLVDPLRLPDLGTLGDVLADPGIVKVLHGAEYDVLCLGRDFSYRMGNLFDTRVASRSLGWKKSGLGDLLWEVFEVKVDKRFQRANWGKRPLSAEMLDYARLDTHYLLDLRRHLMQHLEEQNLVQPVHEMCQWMALIPPSENGFDPEAFWRITHVRELSRPQIAVLRELYIMRDALARQYDRPPFKVLGDANLLSIAKLNPTTKEQLRTPVGLTQRQVDRFAGAILPAIQRGQRAALPRKPRSNHRDDEMVGRYDALREWRKTAARRHKVESDIILPREIMEAIAREAPHDRSGLRTLMEPLEWRFRTFGGDILNVLRDTKAKGAS